jgi:hypothetical protein
MMRGLDWYRQQLNELVRQPVVTLGRHGVFPGGVLPHKPFYEVQHPTAQELQKHPGTTVVMEMGWIFTSAKSNKPLKVRMHQC